jgi:hypothetical protein
MHIDININDLIHELELLRRSGQRILSQPLGFYRILITARNGTSPGFMLHAWLDKEQPRQSIEATHDIHSHTFDMKSRVLVGALRNELYNVTEDSEGSHQLAKIRQEGPKATRLLVGKTVRVLLDRSEVIGAGEVYGFPSRRFHCTQVSSFPTITLMQKMRMISDEALNIMPRHYAEEELGTYAQPELDQERLWNRVLAGLKEAR